jgi:hypothetical protein
MILERGERIIFHGGASLLPGGDPIPGKLYLSNFRILFEAGAGGPNPYTALVEPIDRVLNVHAGRTTKFLEGHREFLTIESVRGRAVFEVGGAQTWAQHIVRARHELPPVPPPSGVQAPTPAAPRGHGSILINIPAPVAPQVMLHCRHCGSLNPAGHVHCTSCGATL